MAGKSTPISLIPAFVSGIVVNLISSFIYAYMTGDYRIGFLIFFLIFVALAMGLFIYKKYVMRPAKLYRAARAQYFYSFELTETLDVFKEIEESFFYIGISADSIMEPLRRLITERKMLTCRILLMKPDSKALIRQVAFESGYGLETPLDTISADAKEDLQSKVTAAGQRIKGAISILKSLPAHKDGRLEIRLYDEFSPWWVYVVDDRKAYIGILERGIRGEKSPVVIFERKDTYSGPFDAFSNNWERIWNSAKIA